MLLYYITDRKAFPGDEPTRHRRILDKIAEAASAGVNYIQLREKDLSTRDLESLAREAMNIIRKQALPADHRRLTTALLINSRTDVALATEAGGVHLRADDISPSEVRKIWSCGARKDSPPGPIIAVSCHSPAGVIQAARNKADLAVFAPIFEKRDVPGTRPAGLAALAEACRATIPVLALGGITLENAQSCIEAGAAGIAAIRLFQENDIAQVVQKLSH